MLNQLPAPQAVRLRRPSWRDPRLVVGVLLVLGSVVLGSRVVAAADDTVAVYAAPAELVPGDPVEESRLTVVQVRLDSAQSGYVAVADGLPDGGVALRPVGAGELLPRSAVGHAADLEHRPVGIPVTGPVPGAMAKGALVDVWVSEPDGSRAGTFLEPVRLAEAAQVAEVSGGGGAFGSSGTTTVQVLLAEEELRQALRALAADADIALVLVPGSSGDGG